MFCLRELANGGTGEIEPRSALPAGFISGDGGGRFSLVARMLFKERRWIPCHDGATWETNGQLNRSAQDMWGRQRVVPAASCQARVRDVLSILRTGGGPWWTKAPSLRIRFGRYCSSTRLYVPLSTCLPRYLRYVAWQNIVWLFPFGAGK